MNNHSWELEYFFLSNCQKRIWINSKDIENVNTINEPDSVDVYKILYTTTEKYSFFSKTYRTFKKDYMVSSKLSLKFQKIETMQSKFSEHK